MKFQLDVTGKRKLWFLISALIILPGIISLLIQGLNLGIDFQGGTLLQLRFESAVGVGEVREVLTRHGFGQGSIQSGGGNSVFIRAENIDEDQRREIVAALDGELGSFDIMRIEKVGAVISGELRSAAFLALFLASILMIAYITLRFEFKFAIAAILALLHDVLAVVGIFSLFRIQIDSTFVAAILTIVGYSVNDTIVFFDRIRENLKGHRKKLVTPIVNESVNQVLIRAINTSLTTLFVIVALLFLGGETTKTFALALFIGVVVGTYSSIFIANNIWAYWRDRDEVKRLALHGASE
ncbi:MAG: protein translocase subunit SecF [Firmicutes bacterium]|nr:protein translocase subunit SecF [Bacillota bacterium]